MKYASREIESIVLYFDQSVILYISIINSIVLCMASLIYRWYNRTGVCRYYIYNIKLELVWFRISIIFGFTLFIYLYIYLFSPLVFITYQFCTLFPKHDIKIDDISVSGYYYIWVIIYHWLITLLYGHAFMYIHLIVYLTQPDPFIHYTYHKSYYYSSPPPIYL